MATTVGLAVDVGVGVPNCHAGRPRDMDEGVGDGATDVACLAGVGVLTARGGVLVGLRVAVGVRTRVGVLVGARVDVAWVTLIVT
jgi:hypothetical protein